jgi:hypothetical protein
MAVYWRLKELLEAYDIQGAAALHLALAEDLGLQVSPQALAKLLRKSPESLKISTAQMLCTLLQVPMQDFLVITPEPKVKNAKLIQPYVKNSQEPNSLFIDPIGFI